MKTKHFLFATLLAVILTGCYDDDKLWDAVNQQATRIEALESWQKETNSNIQALQTLVSTQDYITQVTPVTLGGDTVGYTIAFKNSTPISIYHGQKGDTGEQGIAGTVPTISATQEADGNWYWTLNGALMKDASGNPVRANGQTGPAAPTPLLKTGKELTAQGTSGNWISDAAYLSVDNGNSWKKVSGDDGKDGTDGSNGSSGDSMFSKVTTFENEGYVAFQLSNGKEFQVPIYKDLTLSFSYKSLPNEKLDLNSEILITNDNNAISYNIEGKDINNVKVSAMIADGDNWKLKVDHQNKIITFTSFSIGIANLSITATDNAGHYCNYQLTLKRETFVGEGTKDDPFTISTPYELEHIAREVNNRKESYSGRFFKLSNDLDLTGIEWTPIGGKGNLSFQGTFDGNKHTIRGLKVDPRSNGYAGLFGSTKNATLKNITLISPEVKTDGGNCGSLVGHGSNTTIENCNIIDGYCSAYESAGGLIGNTNYGIIITNCHVKNTKVTANSEVGGLIGSINTIDKTADITNCSATECKLNATNGSCGGLIGIFYMTTLKLTACYATGSINSSKDYVGGLLGGELGAGTSSITVNMTGCYSTITFDNGDASFTLQGAKSPNGTSTFKACYYITSQKTGTVDGITYQEKIDDAMISEMNKACGKDYYDQYGTLISKP